LTDFRLAFRDVQPSAISWEFRPGAIAIIGGADGPTAIFLSAKLAPHLLGAIAIAAYSYMALVPVILPPIMKLLTTEKERKIHMKPPKWILQGFGFRNPSIKPFGNWGDLWTTQLKQVILGI